jgi:tetratricopeptide (TPR) repeat protein
VGKKRRKTSGKIRKKSNRSAAQRAKMAVRQGNLDKAILILQSSNSDIQEAHRQAPLAELYFQRAYRYYDVQPEQALEDLRQVAKLQPDDALYAYHLALTHHRNNNLKEAIQWYRSALERVETFERLYFPLALALHQNGENVKQDAIWQNLTNEQKAYLTKDGGTADVLLQGLNKAEDDNWDEAEAHFQVVVADKKISSQAHAIAHDYLGRLTLRRDDTALPQALKHWRQAYDDGLRSQSFLDNLALAYTLQIEALLQTNDISVARELLSEAIQYFPDHPRLQVIQSHLLLRTGYTAATENNWVRALQLWEKVENPEGEVARRLAANMALAYEKLERWYDAAESWREFARRRGHKKGATNWLSPEQVARLWSRISNLYMRAGHEDEAITTLQTALKYDPDDLEMGVELARRYAEVERTEAAHNQIDRVMKTHPTSAKALTFKAELCEVAPQGWVFGNRQAMVAWEKVIETEDEAYAPIARQNLKELYIEEFERMASWGFGIQKALEVAEEGLKRFPDFSYLRAQYIGGLLDANKSKKQIQKQIEQLDLSDEEALHRLVDIFHIFEKHKMATDLLEKANVQAPLSAPFYSGIGSCAINREQYDIAETYYAKALQVANNDEETKRVLVDQAMAFSANQQDKKADEILKEVFKRDARFGPAHLAAAMLNAEKGNMKDAKWNLKKAERWAQQEGNPEMVAMIEKLRYVIDNPFASMLPSGMLDMDMDEFFDDFDDFDNFEED